MTRLSLLRGAILIGALLGSLSAIGAPRDSSAAPRDTSPAWWTYQHDAARTGVDPTQPTVGSAAFDWSVPLDGAIFAQPLVVGGTVIVATERNSVYAIDATSHAVRWHSTVGPPATSGLQTGCGDPPATQSDPVGITGTPVVDTASGTVYVVALTQPPSAPLQYVLAAFNLSNGALAYSVPINPTTGNLPFLPAFDPSTQGQRGALALSQGRVYVAFGGIAGDCGGYRGWVWSAFASNGSSPLTYEVPARASGGGIWSPAGPSVDPGGDLYVATGNSMQDETADLSESVIRLAPFLQATSSWTATAWPSMNDNDLDVGSFGPLPLTNAQFAQYNGLLFQAAKTGDGWLLNGQNLGGIGGELFNGAVCGDEILGGAAFVPPTIYVACSRTLQAVHLSTSGSPSFSASTLRAGYAGTAALGASTPVFSGGWVWDVDILARTLVMIDPASGQQRTFPLTGQPANFSSLSSGAGHIFVPAGTELDAFAIAPASASNSVITPLAQPVRVVDTRSASTGPIAGGQSRCFPVAGLNGIPSDAAGVVLNFTAVDYLRQGWLSVYSSGEPLPSTSTLDFDPSEYAVANSAIVRLGPARDVCVLVGTVGALPGSTDVVIDATGYLSSATAGSLPLLGAPQRVADTRLVGGPVPSGQTRCFAVGGQAGIPPDAAAAVLNVTAVGYGTQGWLTAYPAGQPVPPTSTLNFDPATYAAANNVVMRLGTAGSICVAVGTLNSAPGSSQVVIDATGYLTSASLNQLALLAPQRLVDTRSNGGPIPSGQARCFTVAGLDGVPSTVDEVVLNVTAVGYSSQGWLTVYPSDEPVPATSTLNFDPMAYAVAEGTISRVGVDGQVCVFVGTVGSVPDNVNVVLDVAGATLGSQVRPAHKR